VPVCTTSHEFVVSKSWKFSKNLSLAVPDNSAPEGVLLILEFSSERVSSVANLSATVPSVPTTAPAKPSGVAIPARESVPAPTLAFARRESFNSF
jgi:hypothetical protein